VEALAVLARGKVELFLKHAAQVNAGAKPALLSNALKGITGLLKQLSGGGQARFGHVAGRWNACVPGKDPGEIARAHRRFLGQIFYAQVGSEVL
jgi:hypothetical protein